MANTTYSSGTGEINFYIYNPDSDKWLETFMDGKFYETHSLSAEPKIDKIVYLKDGRTITKWDDGDEIVVKCGPHDEYNQEYGLVACILKKKYGGSWSGVEKHFLNPIIENAMIIEP